MLAPLATEFFQQDRRVSSQAGTSRCAIPQTMTSFTVEYSWVSSFRSQGKGPGVSRSGGATSRFALDTQIRAQDSAPQRPDEVCRRVAAYLKAACRGLGKRGGLPPRGLLCVILTSNGVVCRNCWRLFCRFDLITGLFLLILGNKRRRIQRREKKLSVLTLRCELRNVPSN